MRYPARAVVLAGASQLKVNRLLPVDWSGVGGGVGIGAGVPVAKAKGEEWGLSVPSLKVAVRVKLVVAAVKVT